MIGLNSCQDEAEAKCHQNVQILKGFESCVTKVRWRKHVLGFSLLVLKCKVEHDDFSFLEVNESLT